MRLFKLVKIFPLLIISMMCTPPSNTGADALADKQKLDSLRNLRCPRLMSSAAEYYRNRDWKQTVKMLPKEIVQV